VRCILCTSASLHKLCQALPRYVKLWTRVSRYSPSKGLMSTIVQRKARLSINWLPRARHCPKCGRRMFLLLVACHQLASGPFVMLPQRGLDSAPEHDRTRHTRTGEARVKGSGANQRFFDYCRSNTIGWLVIGHSRSCTVASMSAY
jgi:hypothetical protein